MATTSNTVKVLMWNVSSPIADLLFDISNWLLMAGALAVFIGTIGSFTMAVAKEHFADQRISANETETARANAEAEKAKEGVAKANERAATLEKQAAEAKLETQRLKEKVSWRTVEASQIVALKEALRGESFDVEVNWLREDPESGSYAYDLISALTKSGLHPIVNPLSLVASANIGLSVLPDTNGHGAKLLGALREAKIAAGEASASDVAMPRLMVGSKPKPVLK